MLIATVASCRRVWNLLLKCGPLVVDLRKDFKEENMRGYYSVFVYAYPSTDTFSAGEDVFVWSEWKYIPSYQWTPEISTYILSSQIPSEYSWGRQWLRKLAEPNWVINLIFNYTLVILAFHEVITFQLADSSVKQATWVCSGDLPVGPFCLCLRHL